MLAGCADSPEVVTLPASVGPHSILISHEGASEAWRFQVLGPEWSQAKVAPTGPILVAEFSAPLDLPSDRGLNRSDLYQGACVLLEPDRYLELEDEFRVLPDPEVPEPVTAILRALARPDCARCVAFDEAAVPLSRLGEPTRSGVSDLEFLAPDRVLALTPTGAALVSREGELGWFEGCERFYVDATRLPNGQIFATDGQHLDELGLDLGSLSCTVLSSTLTPYRAIKAIVGIERDGEAVIYGLSTTTEGVGFCFDRSGFSEVVRIPVAGVLQKRTPSLVFDPDRGPVYSEGTVGVQVEVDGAFQRIVATAPGLEFRGMSSVEGWGVLVFVDQGLLVEAQLLEPSSNAFQTLAPALGESLTAVVPLRGGFVGRSTGAEVNEYHRDLGLCPNRQLEAAGTAYNATLMVRDEEENIFSAVGVRSTRSREQDLHWMRPRPIEAPSSVLFP